MFKIIYVRIWLKRSGEGFSAKCRLFKGLLMSTIASRIMILMLVYSEFPLVLSRLFVEFETCVIVGGFTVRRAGIG